MATTKQRQTARRNVKAAQRGAQKKQTLKNLPAKTRTAMGKEGAKVRSGEPSREDLYKKAQPVEARGGPRLLNSAGGAPRASAVSGTNPRLHQSRPGDEMPTLMDRISGFFKPKEPYKAAAPAAKKPAATKPAARKPAAKRAAKRAAARRSAKRPAKKRAAKKPAAKKRAASSARRKPAAKKAAARKKPAAKKRAAKRPAKKRAARRK
jgi:hypothetical protein